LICSLVSLSCYVSIIRVSTDIYPQQHAKFSVYNNFVIETFRACRNQVRKELSTKLSTGSAALSGVSQFIYGRGTVVSTRRSGYSARQGSHERNTLPLEITTRWAGTETEQRKHVLSFIVLLYI